MCDKEGSDIFALELYAQADAPDSPIANHH